MQSLTLITHNTYWFQGAPSLWGEQREEPHPAVLNQLMQLYRDLKPDVLCLQEVPSAEVSEQTGTCLGMTNVFCRGGMRPVYGGSILWKGATGEMQNLSRYEVRTGRVFERICMVLRMSTSDTVLTLVNIHLSSNRFAPDGQGEPIRMDELQALFRACPEPDVVMGDFNATPDSPIYRFMEARGYVDSGSGKTPANERRIDYIWIRKRLNYRIQTYQSISGDTFLCETKPHVKLSDHPPIVLRLEMERRVL